MPWQMPKAGAVGSLCDWPGRPVVPYIHVSSEDCTSQWLDDENSSDEALEV